MLTITIVETDKDGKIIDTIITETTPEQDMGLDHAGDIDNQGEGARPKLSNAKLVKKAVREYLKTKADEGAEYIASVKASEIKTFYADKSKQAAIDAFIATLKG